MDNDYETERAIIKDAIATYEESQNKQDFLRDVASKVFTAEQVWQIIDQLFDLGEIKSIDFKDLY